MRLRLVVPSQGGRGRAGCVRLGLATATASSLAKQLGGRTLFRDVSFKLEPGDRMTLSGRNGSGKTTLLRALAGELSFDTGTLSLRKGARVALHDQRPPRSDLSLREYVLSGMSWVLEIERTLTELERRMEAGDAEQRTLSAYADAQTRLELAGGYRWRDEATATVRALGFGDAELDRPLSGFSGGELTRASLARALAARPDLLLLDEPTNHLDIGSLEWLERYLVDLDAAVVLVAHDRWFLESVGTSVLELEVGRARFFAGPWHAWREEKAARELAAGRDVERRKAEIARMQRFVERFRYKATKARQAQSRLKKIERLKRDGLDAGPGAERSLSFSFGDAQRSGRVVLELEDARLEVPGRVLLEQGEMWLERGEHVTLIGPNGAGKSTLVEALSGRRRLDGGRVKMGHKVTLGYLAQHAEVPASPGTTVLAHAQHETGLSEAKVRSLLGQFLFSGEDVMKPVADISGGEARRLALAILVSSDSNLLILDEPTNHLDVESREALEDALRAFAGTVLLISHDRALLEAVGSRTIVFENARLRAYHGGWAEYRAAEQRTADERKAAGSDANGGRRTKRADRGPSKNRIADAKRLEAEVEAAEAALRALEDELADPSHWASPQSSAKATRRHERAQRELDELYARWEQALERAGLAD